MRDKEWIRDTLVRTVKTFAETFISMVTVGSSFGEVDWISVLSVSGVSALICVMTCIAGIK